MFVVRVATETEEIAYKEKSMNEYEGENTAYADSRAGGVANTEQVQLTRLMYHTRTRAKKILLGHLLETRITNSRR